MEPKRQRFSSVVGGGVLICHLTTTASAQYVITTVAGNGTAAFSGDGGPATSAALSSPSAVALDATGNLYIADTDNNRIRKVTPDGIIRTVAGNGSGGCMACEGGPATNAELRAPEGIAVDRAGNLFIADTGNHRVRKVTPEGIFTRVAGLSQFEYPRKIAVNLSGNLYIAYVLANSSRSKEKCPASKAGIDGSVHVWPA